MVICSALLDELCAQQIEKIVLVSWDIHSSSRPLKRGAIVAKQALYERICNGARTGVCFHARTLLPDVFPGQANSQVDNTFTGLATLYRKAMNVRFIHLDVLYSSWKQ